MFLKTFTESFPLISILLYSFIITLVMTWLYKRFSDQEAIKSAKEKTKSLQEQIKNEKDQTKIIQLQKDMLELSMEQMRHGMKPMLITFIPLIAAFAGLRYLYTGMGNIMDWNFNIPIFCKILPGICNGAGWFLSYIIFSMTFSVIIRKILKVH